MRILALHSNKNPIILMVRKYSLRYCESRERKHFCTFLSRSLISLATEESTCRLTRLPSLQFAIRAKNSHSPFNTEAAWTSISPKKKEKFPGNLTLSEKQIFTLFPNTSTDSLFKKSCNNNVSCSPPITDNFSYHSRQFS
jgi:hypothetical protein